MWNPLIMGFISPSIHSRLSHLLTCIQQLLHHVEVRVGNAVMQGRVAVAVGHVGDVVQHGRGDVPEGTQVVLHHGGQRRLLAGHAEPFVLNRIHTGSLRAQQVESERAADEEAVEYWQSEYSPGLYCRQPLSRTDEH